MIIGIATVLTIPCELLIGTSKGALQVYCGTAASAQHGPHIYICVTSELCLTFFFLRARSYAPCSARFLSLTVRLSFPSSSSSSTYTMELTWHTAAAWHAFLVIHGVQLLGYVGLPFTSFSSSFSASGSLFIFEASLWNLRSFLLRAISFALCGQQPSSETWTQGTP